MTFLALAVGLARAGSVDLYGFGASEMGRAGGGFSLADGPDQVFSNPAGMWRMPRARAAAGYVLLRNEFDAFPPLAWDTNRDGQVDEADTPLDAGPVYDRADGVQFSLGRPIGGRFGVGFAGFVPIDHLFRLQTFDPAIPTYFMYANRSHRYELALGFGWEQLPGLAIGGAVQVLARVRYHITVTVDARVHGPREGEGLGGAVDEISMDVHEMTLDLVPSFVPVASLQWDVGQLLPALDGLQLAAGYRGASGVPVDVDVDLQANVDIDELGSLGPLVFTALFPFQLDVYDHYLPETINVGVGWRQGQAWSVSLDARRMAWDRMRLSIAHVSGGGLSSQLLKLDDPEIADKNEVSATFRPTVGVRLSGELWSPTWEPQGGVGTIRVGLRGGLGYQPTPLVSQSVGSVLLDSDRLLMAGGLGVEHGDPFHLVQGPICWDLFGQVQTLASGSLDPGASRAGTPIDGSDIPIGGHLWSAGAQWSIDY